MVSDTALAAVTNPDNLAGIGGRGGDPLFLNVEAAVEEIRQAEDVDEAAAWQLGRDAVEHLGGDVDRGSKSMGLAAGRNLRHYYEKWSVPRSAMRLE